jgi:menaquinol-cytochrome c reductase iron-sulfur subunit
MISKLERPTECESLTEQDDFGRRRFLLSGIFGLWGIIGASLFIPSLRYLFRAPKAKKEDLWVKATSLSELTVNSPEEVVFRRNRVDGWKISSEKATAWIVKKSDDRAVAFAPQCTHLGCAYHWDESKSNFVCPCHSSVFSIEGEVLSGPAPRRLDRYAVQVERGDLLVGPLETPGQKG